MRRTAPRSRILLRARLDVSQVLRDEFGPVAKDIERCQKAAAAAAARAKEAAKRKKQGEEDAAKAAKAAWAAAKDGKKAADEAVDRVAKGDGAMPAEPTGQPALEGAKPGSAPPGSSRTPYGIEIRFLRPNSAAETAVTASAVAALGLDKALACPVVGGWPHGRPFGVSVTLKVPLSAGAGAGALTALYKADDDAPWTVLPAAQVARSPDGSAARISGLKALCYIALAKTKPATPTKGDDDGFTVVRTPKAGGSPTTSDASVESDVLDPRAPTDDEIEAAVARAVADVATAAAMLAKIDALIDGGLNSDVATKARADAADALAAAKDAAAKAVAARRARDDARKGARLFARAAADARDSAADAHDVAETAEDVPTAEAAADEAARDASDAARAAEAVAALAETAPFAPIKARDLASSVNSQFHRCRDVSLKDLSCLFTTQMERTSRSCRRTRQTRPRRRRRRRRRRRARASTR